MRVAVIGCGSIGTRHATNLSKVGHEVSCFDVDQGRAEMTARAIGGFAPIDGQTLQGDLDYCRDRAEAVLICTPASTHAAVARELLNLGYHGPLFIEKPLALSIEEAEIFRVWPHPVVMVGYNWRWNLEVGLWWHTAARGQTPTRVVLLCRTDYATWPGAGYADPLLECSHEIDLAFGLLGASLRLVHAQSVGPSGLLLDFVNDDLISARVDLSWDAKKPRRSFYARTSDRAYVKNPSPASIDASYIAAIQHFLACISENRTPDCSVADGIRVLQVMPQIAEKLRAVHV